MPTEHDVVVGPSLHQDDAASTAVKVHEDDRTGQAATPAKVEQQERVEDQRMEAEQIGLSSSTSTHGIIAPSSAKPQVSGVSIPVHPDSAASIDNARPKLRSATEASTSQVVEGSNPTIKSYISEPAAEIAVPVGDPYRRRTSRTLKPKGILKPPPPPQTKFSFRRDVLSYVVSESTSLHSLNPISAALHLAGSGTVSTGKDVASAEAVSNAGGVNGSVGYDTTPSTSNSRDILPQAHNTRLSSTVKPLGGGAGGLWKRLGGAVSAVTASVAASQSISKPSIGPASPRLLAESSTMSPQTQNDELSASAQASTDNLLKTESIKSVRFTMSSLAIVYPINGPQPPGKEADTRKRVNLEHRAKHELQNKEGGWTNGDLLTVYEECCRTREHPGIPTLRRLFMSTSAPPKSINLQDIPLNHGAAELLSDILSINFGLKKLILDNCSLDDESIKPIIHALLVSGSLPSLSLANNRKIRSRGWRMIAFYMRQAALLRYIDLSDNPVDKRIADLLGQAISSPMNASGSPPNVPNIKIGDPHPGISGTDEDAGISDEEIDPFTNRSAPLLRPAAGTISSLSSLRLENCSLRNPVLESLAHSIRQSSIKHISLRKNRINHLGAVALAVMIRDYELSTKTGDTSTSNLLLSISSSGPGDQANTSTSERVGSVHRGTPSGNSNSVTARLNASLNGPASTQKPLPSTPHRINAHQSEVVSPSSPSSTSIADLDDQEVNFGPDRNSGRVSVTEREAMRHAEMRHRLHKQIEALPRVGNLLTLDVRSNDIRGGVTYLSQVLKRNRTLRVLNLSDNKIEPAGLASIAEALKYNTTLETLDLSNNPCCGPSLDGLRALRTALVLNTSLMRLFLNSTGFESTGAIALAEYLPDMQSLIHLDVTDNPQLDIAGIMALAASLKLNTVLRCLDLSIPPNDPDFARLSQDILQSCVRNTEAAQGRFIARGQKGHIATPIYTSELAKDLKELEIHSQEVLNAVSGGEAEIPDEWRPLLKLARHCIDVLTSSVSRDEELVKQGHSPAGRFAVQAVYDQSIAAQMQLSERSMQMSPGTQREAVGSLSSHMAVLLQRASTLYEIGTSQNPPLRLSTTDLSTQDYLSPNSPIRPPMSPNQQIPSPSFSITDSDGSEVGSSDSDGDAEVFGSASQDHVHNVFEDKGTTKMDSPASAAGSPEEVLYAVDSSRTPPRSPVEKHSRTLTLEEGEVFRKGISRVGQAGDKTLLDILDDNSEAEGEELRQEILETEVQRPRRPSLSLSDPDSSIPSENDTTSPI